MSLAGRTRECPPQLGQGDSPPPPMNGMGGPLPAYQSLCACIDAECVPKLPCTGTLSSSWPASPASMGTGEFSQLAAAVCSHLTCAIGSCCRRLHLSANITYRLDLFCKHQLPVKAHALTAASCRSAPNTPAVWTSCWSGGACSKRGMMLERCLPSCPRRSRWAALRRESLLCVAG